MKRYLFLIVLLLVFLYIPACAEIFVLDEIYASIEIPDEYIVINEYSIDSYATWLEARGTSKEETLSDFEKRGVLLQAWSKEGDICFEVTAVTNKEILNVFDLNEQSSTYRGTYRTGHSPHNIYEDQGYHFANASWNNTDNGRFLVMQYTKKNNTETSHKGFMRRTIRNGYEITLDLQVHGRNSVSKDNNTLNGIWNTFSFIEILPLPAQAQAQIQITLPPPVETNSKTFEIQGSAAKGVELTAVVMGLSHPDPIVSTTTLAKTGKFKMPIELPKEGVFLLTLLGEHMGEEVIELAYPITYQRSLLTIFFNTEVPTTVTTKELIIAGKGEKSASIQTFVNGEAYPNKKITSEGKFKITIDTEDEGEYEVVLVFSKKGLADRRFIFNITRHWTQEDMIEHLQKQAKKPSYSSLSTQEKDYLGVIIGYKGYLLNTQQSGESYVSQIALSKKSDEYNNVILVTSKMVPPAAEYEQIMMYGTYTGMSIPPNENEGQTENNPVYPCFDLLLYSSVE